MDSSESRGKFNLVMESIGLGELQIAAFLLENSYEDMISKMMISKTRAIMRVYLIEGFDFA